MPRVRNTVDMKKFVKLKPLVDSKQLSMKDACTLLDISPHLFRKFNKELDEFADSQQSDESNLIE